MSPNHRETSKSLMGNYFFCAMRHTRHGYILNITEHGDIIQIHDLRQINIIFTERNNRLFCNTIHGSLVILSLSL